MGRNRFSGCFDLRLSRPRRDSRAAQQDKFETFLRKLTFLSCGNQTDPLPKSKPIKIKVQQNQSATKSKFNKIKIHKKSKSIKIKTMSNPGHLFRPYEKLVKITLGEKQFEVPEGNMLLRALQFLSPEDVSYGRFCWNEECQYCRVDYDLGPETQNRTAISCKLMVQDGMRITEVAQEIKYCLRKLELNLKVKETK